MVYPCTYSICDILDLLLTFSVNNIHFVIISKNRVKVIGTCYMIRVTNQYVRGQFVYCMWYINWHLKQWTKSLASTLQWFSLLSHTLGLAIDIVSGVKRVSYRVFLMSQSCRWSWYILFISFVYFDSVGREQMCLS